jgi:hypothetical protein
VPALAILTAIRALAGRALSFLGKLNLWQVLLVAALLFAGSQTLRLKAEQGHSAKVEQQLSKAVSELKRIASAKDTQRTVTKTNIVTVTKTIHDADRRAKVVEAAPLPGNCQTPPEVLSADL